MEPVGDPIEIVRCGYDRVAAVYDAWNDGSAYRAWFDEAFAGLHAGARILDLGCGAGRSAAILADRGFDVTGIDLSVAQIALARRRAPTAAFVCGDMSTATFAPASFEAAIALYSLIHIPIALQPALIARLATWLLPDAPLVATVGADAWTGTEPDWLGVPGGTMYWSHGDAATYRTWFVEGGFAVERERFVPEGDGGHTLLIARRR